MKTRYLVKIVATLLMLSNMEVCVKAVAASEGANYKLEQNISASKYDPREVGLSTPVKNQGQISTCWDFAGMATLESFLKLNGYGEYDLSEEHARWFGITDKDGYGWYRNQDDFGWQETMLGYLTSGIGPKLEDDVPYIGSSNELKGENMDNATTQFRVTDIVYVDSGIESVKTAIKKYGAVSSRYVNDMSFLSKSGKEYNCNNYKNNKSGHMISVVGWDDNYPKDNFNEMIRPIKNGAWLIKNSWGTTIGDEGYLWISYEDMYLLKSSINFSIKNITPLDIKSKIYQYDMFGSTMTTSMYDFEDDKNYNKLTCGNVYDFNTELNVLDSVMFMTDSKGAKYEISYAPYANETIDMDNKVKITEGIIKDKGYLTVPINSVELPKGKGAILITIEYTDLDKAATIGCEMSRSLDGNYEFKAEVNTGESYIILKGKAVDTINIKPMNFTIKVTTKRTEIKPINNDGDLVISKLEKDKVSSSSKQTMEDSEQSSDENFNYIIVIGLIATLFISVITIIIKKRGRL